MLDLAESISGRVAAALEKHPLAAWAAFTAFYLVTCALVMRHKPLWYDEIVTLYVDRLPSWAALWTALADGAEANPPLFHVLTRASLAVFGDNPAALRAPAILSFWVMSLCLFLILARRVPVLAAWAGVLLPLGAQSAYYATEARPYAPALAFGSLAILCWQRLGEATRRRGIWLAGLTLSLAAALSSHYYAASLLFPLAVGECVRSLERRRVDWVGVAALAAALAPLALYVPLIRGAALYSTNAFAAPTITAALEFYPDLLRAALTVLILIIVCGLAWTLARRQTGPAPAPAPAAEAALALALCLLPLAQIAFARIFTGVFVPRYAVFAIWGCCGLVAYFLAFAGWRGQTPALAAVVLLAGLALARPYAWRLPQGVPDIERIDRLTSQRGLILAFSDGIHFLEYFNAAPPELRERIAYIADPVLAHRATGSNALDIGMHQLRKYVPLPVFAPDEFCRRQPSFLLMTSEDGSWQVNWLLERGARLEVLGHDLTHTTYLVTMPIG